MCGNEINRALTSLKHHFRSKCLSLAPGINVAHTAQELVGDINLKSFCTSEKVSWQFNICVNTTAVVDHTERERDCTNTLITISMQHVQKKIKPKHLPRFCFKLQEKHNITLSYDYHFSLAIILLTIKWLQSSHLINIAHSSICHHMVTRSFPLI